MLQRVTGTVLESLSDGLVVDVQGLGFFIFTLDPHAVGDTITLHTHLAVKQDGMDLYGFKTAEDLAFFKKCLTVSGVGPKTALSFLRRSPRDKLQNAIARKDTEYLTRVVGLGKKASDKLILELSEKITASETSEGSDDGDVLDTLIALGYTEREARSALQTIPDTIIGKDARLRAALSHS